MKQIISLRDLQEMVRNGGDVRSLPADAIYTPSARDYIRDLENNNVPKLSSNGAPSSNGARAAAPAAPAKPAKPVTLSSSAAEIEAWFNSPEITAKKEEICEVGRRMWARNYVDANGGNISLKVTDELVLCTPTLISKGFMKPSDICLVDMEGNQKAGTKKRTSEILMHLQMMKRQPRAISVVHCHPPHGTAFAVANVEPPACMIPEFEVFIGKVPIAPYRTPGTPEMGKLVADLVEHHNTVLMGNHGAVAWSHLTVEDAYFKMEVLEAYCRTVWVASQLGGSLKGFSTNHLQDLLKIKQTLGIPDPRIGLKECELCNNDEWRPGVMCAVPPKQVDGPAPDGQAEALVQAITEEIIKRMK